MKIPSDYVFRDATFCQIKDWPNYFSCKVLDEFYDNVIKTQPNSWHREFSNIYVLVANNNSPTCAGERQWKDILCKSQLQFIEKHDYLIVGWMCFERNMASDDYEFISYIDTRVPSEGIAYFMMHSYFIRFDKLPLPFEIIEKAITYDRIGNLRYYSDHLYD